MLRLPSLPSTVTVLCDSKWINQWKQTKTLKKSKGILTRSERLHFKILKSKLLHFKIPPMILESKLLHFQNPTDSHQSPISSHTTVTAAGCVRVHAKCRICTANLLSMGITKAFTRALLEYYEIKIVISHLPWKFGDVICDSKVFGAL